MHGERPVDGRRVSIQVEEPSHTRDEGLQVAEVGESRTKPQRRRLRASCIHAEPRWPTRQVEAAFVAVLGRDFDAGDGSLTEPGEDASRVVRLSIGEGKGQRHGAVTQSEPAAEGARAAELVCACRRPSTRFRANKRRGQLEDLLHRLVELPHAGEACRERHVRERQLGRAEECRRRPRPLRTREGQRARAELCREHTTEVA